MGASTSIGGLADKVRILVLEKQLAERTAELVKAKLATANYEKQSLLAAINQFLQDETPDSKELMRAAVLKCEGEQ